MTDFNESYKKALAAAAQYGGSTKTPPKGLSKDRFHTVYKKRLREIATALGLSKEEYDLRSNKAGPAILGEVTLHTNKLYLQVGGLDESQVMYRSVSGRKDYTGGTNHWMSLESLWNDSRCIPAFRTLIDASGGKTSKYGGHGVDIKLQSAHDTHGGRVFWNQGNSYVIVPDDRGEWRTSGGERVTLLSINGIGEIRSRVMFKNPTEQPAADHFGLKII